jgi:hypothetical protein
LPSCFASGGFFFGVSQGLPYFDAPASIDDCRPNFNPDLTRVNKGQTREDKNIQKPIFARILVAQ